MSWKEVVELDNERRAIQQRIQIGAAIGNGSSTVMRLDGTRTPLTDEDRKSVASRDVMQDAVDYIHIQNLQWSLCGVRDTGAHQQLPI